MNALFEKYRPKKKTYTTNNKFNKNKIGISQKLPTKNFPYKNAREFLIDFKSNNPIY